MSVAVENSILDRLRENVLSRVVETENAADTGIAMPFLVVSFGTPIRASGDHGLVSSRNDTKIGSVVVRVVSATAESARQVRDKVVYWLEGWSPENSGELLLEMGIGTDNATPTTKPTRFYQTIGFTYRTNLAWVGEPPTPEP